LKVKAVLGTEISVRMLLEEFKFSTNDLTSLIIIPLLRQMASILWWRSGSGKEATV
jgi:hypothetical protein